MTKEYDTIASLWHSFYELMRNSGNDDTEEEQEQVGLPGTGSHVIAGKRGPSSSTNTNNADGNNRND